MRVAVRRRIAGLALSALTATAAANAQEAASSRHRALEAMTLGGDGPLEVEAGMVSQDPRAVEVALRVAGDLPAAETMMVTVCFGFLDLGDRCFDPFPAATPAAPGQAWEGRLLLDLPDEPVAVGVGVETAPAAGDHVLWGSGGADAADEAIPALRNPQIIDLRPPNPAEAPTGDGAEGSHAVRLVPPAESTLSGSHRFRVLASDPRVDRVVFEVDGEQVAADKSHPYSARIDIGSDGRQRTVVVIAFDAADNELGRDQAIVNEQRVRNRIRLSGVADDAGMLTVTTDLTLTPDATLDRLTIQFAGDTVAELTEPPFETTIDVSDAGPADYVQATATLTDGSTIEDVLLLGGSGGGEQIEVNLTELYAVFFDRRTQEVLDTIDQQAVRITVDGKPQPVERFAPADERPITVGLVIDTSSSMYALIPDAQRAAGRFLSGVLRPGDRAFLVDFDTRPRLAHAASEDRQSLISRLAVLSADGFTALFDSIIYSTLEFPADGRRRALVVLTDGDDYKGKLGPDNAIEYAQAAGVPVYVISLAGIHMSYQAFGRLKEDIEPISKPDIEKVARQTGGRVFYISSLEELPAAYDRILKELTSQYLVTFSTPRELTDSERTSIRLEPTNDKVELRFTVGRPAEG